ncbi:unnamed protein product [Leuciscus chuanchicus]
MILAVTREGGRETDRLTDRRRQRDRERLASPITVLFDHVHRLPPPLRSRGDGTQHIIEQGGRGNAPRRPGYGMIIMVCLWLLHGDGGVLAGRAVSVYITVQEYHKPLPRPPNYSSDGQHMPWDEAWRPRMRERV